MPPTDDSGTYNLYSVGEFSEYQLPIFSPGAVLAYSGWLAFFFLLCVSSCARSRAKFLIIRILPKKSEPGVLVHFNVNRQFMGICIEDF